MSSTITAADFHQHPDLSDWRVLLRRAEALFKGNSFADGAAFVGRIAEAADRAGHHPDVNLRYPGLVHVALTTHAVGGLTAADVALARSISEIARDGALAVVSQDCTTVEIAIDAIDIAAVLPFWKAVMGYQDELPQAPGAQVTGLYDPRRIGPAVWFQQMDTPRPQRNRIHIDVTVAHDVAGRRVAAGIEAGGHLVSDDAARAFWVLADPEGNEACICTWQDRD